MARRAGIDRLTHRLRVLEAATAMTTAQIMLAILPFRWTAAAFGTAAREDTPAGPPTVNRHAAAVGRAVSAAARRLPWSPVCLPQALAASWMLRRRGLASRVCFGVLRENGALKAHAWTTTADGGVVCGGSAAVGFTPLAALRTGNHPR